LIDADVNGNQRVGLLEERVRRAMWRREKHDALGVRRDAVQRCASWRERRHPREKDRVHVLQTLIERLGHGEIAPHDFDVVRQVGGFGASAQRAHPTAGASQLCHNLTADVACRSGDEHSCHRSPY
jgi:hypothetical protein